jgi:hypothetical protein
LPPPARLLAAAATTASVVAAVAAVAEPCTNARIGEACARSAHGLHILPDLSCHIGTGANDNHHVR